MEIDGQRVAAFPAALHLVGQDISEQNDLHVTSLQENPMNETPNPRSFIVSGRLDGIERGNGRFRLVVGQRAVLFGRVDPRSLDLEALRPLWGKHTTVEGIVHFKVNGQPRLIEARRISSHQRGDIVFGEMPTVDVSDSHGLFPAPRKEVNAFDPIELAGTWPGDETIEDLLEQLD